MALKTEGQPPRRQLRQDFRKSFLRLSSASWRLGGSPSFHYFAPHSR
jgi:hypothetical protein